MAQLPVLDGAGEAQNLSCDEDAEGLIPRHADDAVAALLTALLARLPAALVSGRLDVGVGASALPTGAATQATLADILAALGALATQSTLDTINTGIAAAVTRLTEIRDANAITTPIVGSITSAGTTEVALPNIPVKVPIHISIPIGFVGTLTIRDADGGGTEVLGWDDTNGHHKPEAVFYGDNLNDYTYQTSTSGQSFTYRSAS